MQQKAHNTVALLLHLALLVVPWLALSGCGILTIPVLGISNEPMPEQERRHIGQRSVTEVPSAAYLASYDVPWSIDWQCRNTKSLPLKDCQATNTTNRDFIGLAISGGGSRAAIFSAAVIFELQRYGLMQQVDVLSSVSGGSLTAAFYVLSCDPPDPKRSCPPTIEGTGRQLWTPETVFQLLERDFIWRWIGNLLRPTKIFLLTLTRYDRDDLMADTFDHSLFDTSNLGYEGFRFQDLNPQRPSLIINATNNTADHEGVQSDTQILHFGFTNREFSRLNSDFNQYRIADAVMASAAFPGAFHYVTLRNYFENDQYIHLYDGGTSDNLGVTGLVKVLGTITAAPQPPSRKLVIAIDAYIPPAGKNREKADPRSPWDYLLDTNFLDAYGSLMAALREKHFEAIQGDYLTGPNNLLLQVNFEQLSTLDTEEARSLYRQLLTIRTSLSITCEDAFALKRAARILVEDRVTLLRKDPHFTDLVHNPTDDGYEIKPCPNSEGSSSKGSAIGKQSDNKATFPSGP